MAALRTYQVEAVQAVIDARRRGVRRMVVSLPTGAGKTVIFSELSRLARRTGRPAPPCSRCCRGRPIGR